MCDFFSSKPREGTEAYRVQEEVREKKKIAEEKEVKELISELYFNHLRYFPIQIKQSGNYVPKIIDSAIEEKKDEKEVILILLKGKKYRFEFSKRSSIAPDNDCNYGLLELFSDEKKWLSINVSLECSKYSFATKWKPFDIEAFIDGNWINDFRHLKELIVKSENEKLREYKRAEDSKKVQELKDNFGID
ncbi:MAG: hypothetical protein NTW93_02745 [Phycisphaerae bacterium]|nr:hypothetical protein [Phycisphaerae bacterium]